MRILLSMVAPLLSMIVVAHGAANAQQKPKTDNLPLATFYLPGTKTIPVEKRKALYAEAAIAYLHRFEDQHKQEPDVIEEMKKFLVPSEANDKEPEGWLVFTGFIDVAIEKGRATEWTAYNILLLTVDAYLSDKSKQHKKN